MITKQRLKKLEEKAKLRYAPEEFIINYRKPSGEVITLACKHGIASIPSDEQENIVNVKGGMHIFMDRLFLKRDTNEGDKKLYEREGFIILPKENDNETTA